MEYIKQSNFELYMKLIQIEYNEAVQWKIIMMSMAF
jgi:hypothetical protein